MKQHESRSEFEARMEHTDAAVAEAAAYVSGLPTSKPEIALVLGSGLGAIADSVEDPVIVETSNIIHYPASTVSGHRGRLVFGTLGERAVVVIQGRLHLYEGHALHDVVFPIQLVRALGAHCLVVTNAAGGINKQYRPGTLMWITDHINWTWEHPSLWSRIHPDVGDRELIGRLCSSTSFYDATWTSQSMAAARRLGIRTSEGTYLWTRGPSYETKAEIESFRVLGADAVGMSTVPEVEQAREMDMKVIGLSTITNMAAGLGGELLAHEEVLEMGEKVGRRLGDLVIAVVRCAPLSLG